MRHRHIQAAVIAAAFLSVLSPVPSSGQDVGEVPDITTLSRHSDIPSRNPVIEVAWGIPEGDPYGYLVLFDTNPEQTFDGLDDEGATYVTGRSFRSPDLAESQPDGTAYHFHIAAIDGRGEVGPTTTTGPYRMDVVPPSDVGVTAPRITSSRTVTLALKATGASEMHVGDAGCGEAGEWERFSETRKWRLPAVGGERTVCVRFADLAGNTADASVTIRHIVGDLDADLTVGLRDAILILRVLTGTCKDDVNPDADVDGDGRIGIGEVIHILRGISAGDEG